MRAKKIPPVPISLEHGPTVIGQSRHLLQQRHMCPRGPADSSLQVTHRVAGATVEVIAAAHGLQRFQVSK